jgi:uncharacterized integral membrane protein
MRHLKIILLILLGLAVIIVIVQNHEAMSTTVTFRLNTMFFGEKASPNVSIYEVVLLSFLLGVVVTGIYGMVERFHLKRKMKALTRELEDKDRELNSLRNLPITSDFTETAQRGQ